MLGANSSRVEETVGRTNVMVFVQSRKLVAREIRLLGLPTAWNLPKFSAEKKSPPWKKDTNARESNIL